jgi:hypothetical protein
MSRLLLALTAAATFMAAIGTTASARNISISEQRLRANFRELIFRSSSGVALTCSLTLESSFHSRTIAKVVESLVGYITGGAFGGCRGWKLETQH